MEPANLSLRVFNEVYQNQTKLMESIVAKLKDISLMKSCIRLNKVKGFEKKIASIREELIKQEIMFEKPREYLDSYRDIENKAKSPEESTREEYTALQFLLQGQLADRRIRIFSLFEHLQSEMTYKKAEIQFNRIMLLSLTAILVAVTSLALNNLFRR